MAGDSVLRIKAAIDAGDVGQGLQDLVAGITKIGTEASKVAGQSKADWAAMGRELAALDPQLAGIGDEIIKVFNASDKIGTAGAAGNAKQLEAALKAAGGPLDDIRQKLEAVGAVSPEAAAKVKDFTTVANAGWEVGAQKLVVLKDAAAAVQARLDGVAAAASKTGPAIAAGVGPAVPALTAVEEAEKKLEEALKRLEAAQGPRALAKGSRDAQFAMMEYETTATKAGVSTGVLGTKMTDATGRITTAASKSALLTEQMAAVQTKGAMAAMGMEALGTKLSSVGGALDYAKQMGSPLVSKFAELAIGGMGVFMAFELVKKAGEAVAAKIKEVAEKEDALVLAAQRIELAHQQMTIGLRLVEAGAMKAGGSFAEMAANMDRLKVAANVNTVAVTEFLKRLDIKVPPGWQQLETNLEDVEAAFTRATKQAVLDGETWSKANDGLSSSSAKAEGSIMAYIKANEEKLRSIAKESPAIKSALEAYDKYNASIKASTRSAEDFSKIKDELIKGHEEEVKANAELVGSVSQIVAARKAATDSGKNGAAADRDAQVALKELALKYHMTVDELLVFVAAQTKSRDSLQQEKAALDVGTVSVRLFGDALLTSAEKQKAWAAAADAIVAKADAAAAALKRLRDAAKEAETNTFNLGQAADRAMTPIMGMGTSAIQTATSWSSMGVAGAKAASDMQPMVGLWLKVTEATDVQTAALKRQLAALGELSTAQEKVLDTATGWKDYLVQLEDGYNTGVTSLTVYIQALGDFKMQLITLFAGAKGAAKDAIDEMTAMIGKMIATAGSTPPTAAEPGYLGMLNRQFPTQP